MIEMTISETEILAMENGKSLGKIEFTKCSTFEHLPWLE